MRGTPALAAIALGAAVLGGAVALLLANATGIVDDEASTVYVPTAASDASFARDETASSNARPLTGNGFTPGRIYTARSPGVVTVYADFGGDHQSQGSGFIVSDAGDILTSAHVVTNAGETVKTREAKKVYIGFKDEDRVQAEIVGWDAYDDVALLRVPPGAHALEPVPLGDSAAVSAGDPVAAMGSPFGNEDSITVGVISAVSRSISSLTSQYKVVDAIQTDAPITHGNSGGPLFDARGRVIGINAQIRTDTGNAEGVGFAIPINAAKRSMRQLAANGRVVYAFLGVSTESLTPTIARRLGYGPNRGAIVSSVADNGPAAKAGLRGGTGTKTINGLTVTSGGDVIVALDGRPVATADDIVRGVTARVPGEIAVLTIVRGTSRREVRVKLGARPSVPEGLR